MWNRFLPTKSRKRMTRDVFDTFTNNNLCGMTTSCRHRCCNETLHFGCLVEVSFTTSETVVGLLGTGAQDIHLDTWSVPSSGD